MTLLPILWCLLAPPQGASYVQALYEAKKAVEERPNDGEARFVLGRLHLLGIEGDSERVGVQLDELNGMVLFPTNFPVQSGGGKVEGESGAEHVRQAVIHLNRAARIDPNNALYAVANAFAFEQLARNWTTVVGEGSFAGLADAADARSKVAAEYRRAYSMAKDRDLLRRKDNTGPNAWPSVLAAKSLLRLRGEGKARVTQAEADRLTKHVGRFK
jgi:hypothetical protein